MKNDQAGYFPFGYYEGFLKFLYNNRDCIEIITYDDFLWGEDYNVEENYPDEWRRWKSKTKGDKKIYVLLQHDVDRLPLLTERAMHAELKYGLKSNIMMFNRRVQRRHLQSTGEVLFDSEGYTIDVKSWRPLEEQGFVFCYHANAFEQSNFDVEKARSIFEKDVSQLREKFNIRYFSPHGGARSSDGKSNNSLEIPDSLKNSIRWVANGHTARFHGSFSDGGINSKSRDPNLRDLRDFVRTWEKGKRYRVLTHPQYYADDYEPSPRLSEAKWYRDMLHSYGHGDLSCWDDVFLKKDRRRIWQIMR